MVQFSSPPRRERPSAAFNRRHLLLLAFLAVSTPLFVQVVLGAAIAPSTSEAMELLSRPGSAAASRNYHGVVRTPKSSVMRLEGDPDLLSAEGETEVSEEAVQVKNRMNAADYPIKDRTPDVNHPMVKKWVSEIDWSKVPDIPVAPSLPDVLHFPKCPPDEEVDRDSCWWSCDGCVQQSDVVTCPNQNDWGLTYDDGPSEATRNMMQHLNARRLSATFFIVGSRVLEYPDILKEQAQQGHHIAMHTWSHAGLTTLTNEQIVAEIRWSEKIIRDVTGLTMKYVRPPYGDVDNRVREILRQMGYITVIWTVGWDTNDWRIAMHQIMAPQIVSTFRGALDSRGQIRSFSGNPAGPITLEHDLTAGTIALSKEIIPIGMSRGLRPMSLDRCLNDPYPYQDVSRGVHSTTSINTHPNTAPAGGNSTSSDPSNSIDPHGGSTNDHATPESAATNDDHSDAKSDAMVLTGFQSLGYAAMGLTAVASYMLIL
ncbi:chitin deacetylase [Dissophora globulifera]|uniref:Chitin deacetylase n=1 Tax=Dissophora globulifera TaxID=979702 RepID=A0A9P6RTP9_9FUNG|nr:chitin deacetylase [Dissophora globulifera]